MNALTQPTGNTTPKAAVKAYATYLASLYLVVDYSVSPPALFFSNTKQQAAIETINSKWGKWAFANSVRIDDSEPFADFMSKLQARVKAKLPHVFGAAFKPTNERFFEQHEGITKANSFVPFKAPVGEPAPPILMEYFERLFPNSAERKHVIQFLAHSFQFPLIRPMHALMVTGVQGNGKSTIPAMLRRAMGGNHVFDDNSYVSAFTQFSAILPDNMFVVFDDAKADRSTHGRLKMEITRKVQSVNVKYQTHPEERFVYARVIVLSNSPTPMKMDNCRRFYATEFATHTNEHNPEGTKANTDGFFDRFFAWLESPVAPAQLQQFFLGVELEGFNAFSIPQTSTLLAMIDAGQSALTKMIAAYVEDLPCFHINQLYDYVKNNHIVNPSLDAIIGVLDELNYKKKRRVVTGCGPAQQDIWVPAAPAGKTKTRTCTEEESAAIAQSIGVY
jgi:hypothetical protein